MKVWTIGVVSEAGVFENLGVAAVDKGLRGEDLDQRRLGRRGGRLGSGVRGGGRPQQVMERCMVSG